jgi:hypothetical protein
VGFECNVMFVAFLVDGILYVCTNNMDFYF